MGTSKSTIRLGVASADWFPPERTTLEEPIWGGSGWARIAKYLPYLPFEISVGDLAFNGSHFVILDTEKNAHDVDIIIMQRLTHRGLAENMMKAQSLGQKFINDIDDWYWGLDPSNVAFHANHPKTHPDENVNHYKTIISRSDAVLASTRYLGDRIHQWLRGELIVVTNTVDIASFTTRVHADDGPPIVGWVGSTVHRSRDLETVAGVLRPMSNSGEIRLHHSGDSLQAPSFASRIGVPPSAVTTLPLVRADHYPSLMVMDIGIVPLKDTPFNRAKSFIKGLEYAAAGVPFVAQSLDPYLDLAAEGIGRLAKRPVNWIKHLKSLQSAEVRQAEADLHRERLTPFDISVGAARLTDIISNL